MISTAELARLAHHLRMGDRVMEKDYVLSWLLIAIADSELRNGLAFKGGTALKRCYYPDYRFSEDLDFTLSVDLSHDDLVAAFEILFPWPAGRWLPARPVRVGSRRQLLAPFSCRCVCVL